MNILDEYGVELFGTKFRIIRKRVKLDHTSVNGILTEMALYAQEVANMRTQRWLKHPSGEERLTIPEWVEYMSLGPLSEDQVITWLLNVHHINLKEFII